MDDRFPRPRVVALIIDVIVESLPPQSVDKFDRCDYTTAGFSYGVSYLKLQFNQFTMLYFVHTVRIRYEMQGLKTERHKR
jgi:hypothetical protein